MISLVIKEKGHYVEIPGVSPFRTPASVNITHVSIPLVASALNRQGINKFEIISDTPGKQATLTQDDFVAKNKKEKKEKDTYEERFNKLENLMTKILEKETGKSTENKEQITNRLDDIEKLIKKQGGKTVYSKSKDEYREPVVEELDDTFIPDIDLEGMEVKGETTKESIKQDKSTIDDSADLLSSIMQDEK